MAHCVRPLRMTFLSLIALEREMFLMWPLFARPTSEHLLFRSDRVRCSAARRRLRKPVLEPLEDRLVPSVALVVNSLTDNTDLDGVVTLREALLAANTNTTVGDAVHDS